MISVNVVQLIAMFAALLGGGGVFGVWIKQRVELRRVDSDETSDKRMQDRVDFETILLAVTEQREAAVRREERLIERIETLELEIQGLRLSQEIDPFPKWITDLEGRFIFVNREFEREFLEPMGRNYRWLIGRKRNELWPDDFCKKIEALNRQARSRADKRSRATMLLSGCTVTVHKFPVCVTGVPVAYAGFFTQIEEPAAA